MTDERKEQLHKYKELARKKGYGQETIEMGYMLSMTVDMIERFGTKEKTLEEVIKLCEKYDNPQEFLSAIGELIGIE